MPIVTALEDVLPGSTLVEGLEDGDALGSTVLEIGDVDGDGLRDLAFAARNRDDRDFDGRILLGFQWLESRARSFSRAPSSSGRDEGFRPFGPTM